MTQQSLSDSQGKALLRNWPERPSRLFKTRGTLGFWLRAQPPDMKTSGPILVTPGGGHFATQPDGLWLWFSEQDFVDVISIEICRVGQNLNDKRSRYMPTNHALLVSCQTAWFSGAVKTQRGGLRERWRACGTMTNKPRTNIRIPVRHLRVLYALPNALYNNWLTNVTPCAHEYFCCHSSLNSYTAPTFRAFLSKLAPGAQYYTRPK